jgi:hypothetical protein
MVFVKQFGTGTVYELEEKFRISLDFIHHLHDFTKKLLYMYNVHIYNRTRLGVRQRILAMLCEVCTRNIQTIPSLYGVQESIV